ncbi:MAG: hypothetical protein SFX72_11950 [Isosphaeraceae bacterium]|nr:hypothetical protein [Isosphaeraceae bacterium]
MSYRHRLIASLARLPRGVLGTLVLVCGIETMIAGARDRLAAPDQTFARVTSERLIDWVRDCDWIALGSSQTKHSIAPRELAIGTGTRGYNLALSGSQAANSFFLLRRVLESGARPRVVIVDFFPVLQRLSHWHVVENDPFLLDIRESLDLAWSARDPAFFASIVARRAIPSFRYRQSIRTLVRNRATGSGPSDWSRPTEIMLRNHLENRGAQVHPPGEISPDAIARLDREYFPRWEITALQDRYIERFLKLADQAGIRVVWLLTPLHSELSARIESTGFAAAWTRFVRERGIEHPKLSIVDARRLEWGERAFLDPNHLAIDGLAAFSSIFAPELTRVLASPDSEPGCWIDLSDRSLTRTEPTTLVDMPATVRLLRDEYRSVRADRRRGEVLRR